MTPTPVKLATDDASTAVDHPSTNPAAPPPVPACAKTTENTVIPTAAPR
jgi:hypothetical protein